MSCHVPKEARICLKIANLCVENGQCTQDTSAMEALYGHVITFNLQAISRRYF